MRRGEQRAGTGDHSRREHSNSTRIRRNIRGRIRSHSTLGRTRRNKRGQHGCHNRRTRRNKWGHSRHSSRNPVIHSSRNQGHTHRH